MPALSECSLWARRDTRKGVCSCTSPAEGCSLAERDSSRLTTSRGHTVERNQGSLTPPCARLRVGERVGMQFNSCTWNSSEGVAHGEVPPAELLEQGLGVFPCRLEVSMRRRSGDVGVLVVSLMHFVLHVFAQWESAPHELCIIAILAVFVVCFPLVFWFFFFSSWYSCYPPHAHLGKSYSLTESLAPFG